MPNKNYINGTAFEREVVKRHQSDGAVAFRSAGSHSPIDVVAVYPTNRVVLTQCKVTRSESHATKLIKDFLAKPPLQPGHYVQVLEVKIPRKTILTAVVHALNAPA